MLLPSFAPRKARRIERGSKGESQERDVGLTVNPTQLNQHCPIHGRQEKDSHQSSGQRSGCHRLTHSLPRRIVPAGIRYSGEKERERTRNTETVTAKPDAGRTFLVVQWKRCLLTQPQLPLRWLAIAGQLRCPAIVNRDCSIPSADGVDSLLGHGVCFFLLHNCRNSISILFIIR